MKYLIPFSFLLLMSCSSKKELKVYQTETLTVRQLTQNTYQHVSTLETANFGRFPCNGLIVIDKNEAVVFDTPASNEVSLELIDWIKAEGVTHIKAIIPTHFHDDCLAGLQAFHDNGVTSYSSERTYKLALEDSVKHLPQLTFKATMEHHVGELTTISYFPGEGHTRDNIVGYVPKDNVLFGGCLLKSLNSGKGNLEDANVAEWSKSIENVGKKFPEAAILIPGHGKIGDRTLLEYTRKMFE